MIGKVKRRKIEWFLIKDQKKEKKKKEERRRRERGLKRPMETSKNDKNVPVLPIPFPIDPNSGLLFCPHISSIPIGRENFSPPILSFVSHTTTIILLSILLPPLLCFVFVSSCIFSLSSFSLFFHLAFSLSLHPSSSSLFFQIYPHVVCTQRWIQRRASRNFFPLTIFPILVLLVLPPLLDGARLDVASAWHYFARLSHVIFHPFTLNVTPNRLIFRSRAGFLFFFFSLPPRYLLRPHLPLSLIRWPLYIYRVRINL